LPSNLQAETAKDLQLERAAHDETAEKMVQLQQRLEVALQELANLERFTKQQQQPTSALPNVERLLKEESYLQARLLYVQQVRSLGGSPRHLISVLTLFATDLVLRAHGQELADARGDERPDKPSLGAPETEDDAELGI
jgi:DNA repair exonuclease SbcCD ATPase subunit